MAPLLREWFGCEVEPGKGKDFRLRNAGGAAIDPLCLHERIQADAQKQYELYQTAMTLWR